MFRSLIEENKKELDSISKSVKKIGKFQSSLDKKIKKILKQKVGEVKKTLPSSRTEMDECLKKVSDKDLCNIVIGKYTKFYGEVCQATPALCDDFHAPTIHQSKMEPIHDLSKKNMLRI